MDTTVSCMEALVFMYDSLDYTNNQIETCEISGNVPGTLAGTFDECGGEQTVTWTFTDNCGRTINHVQTITIEPAPEADWVDPPADITLSCDEAQNFTVSDLSYTNGESETCEISGNVPGTLAGTFNECGGEQTVTWTFTDSCGRTIEHIQTIAIEPAPVADWVDPPEFTTISCDEVNNYVVEDLSFTNEMTGNCQISGSVIGELSGDFEECGDQLIVTWEYLDFCERVIEYSNTIKCIIRRSLCHLFR